MLDDLLKLFPEKAYSLILAHDPDGLLNEESVLAVLTERGFTIIHETDPIILRHRVETTKPFSFECPVIIRTEESLHTLSYDLWQQGHHVLLGLNTFIPNLSYPILQQLTPPQILRLSQSPTPTKRCGHQGTIEFVLRHVFDLDLKTMTSSDDWVIWLNSYHQSWDSMPNPLLDFMEETQAANKLPNLGDLIQSKDLFNQFMQEQWDGYLENLTGQGISESGAEYILNFDYDPNLKNQVGIFINQGTLSPVEIFEPHKIPPWAQPGIYASNVDPNELRLAELRSILENITEIELAAYRWEQWQSLAKNWAEYTSLSQIYSSDSKEQKTFSKLIDKIFLSWLSNRYSALATQMLPNPHHLFHVPHFMAYQRRKENLEKLALVIMDGMALADWQVISKTWRERNPGWKFIVQYVLAQIPTITAISRQALISGLRPIDFPDTLRNNQAEPKQWITFWLNEDVPADSCAYERHSPKAIPDWIDKPRLEIVCLIDNSIDDIMHNTTLGQSGFYASLKIWLDKDSLALEKNISEMLSLGFKIYLTSDHGHIESSGFGKLSEGVPVQSRSKRARVYNDLVFAEQNQQKVSPSIIWANDGLLPENTFALIPEEHHAFTPYGEIDIAHGGASINEVIIPLVTIRLEK